MENLTSEELTDTQPQAGKDIPVDAPVHDNPSGGQDSSCATEKRSPNVVPVDDHLHELIKPETDSAVEQCSLQSLNAVPDAATAEAESQKNEPMDIIVSDLKEEPCSGSCNVAVGEATVSPISGGGSLTLLSMQYRDDGSEDLSDSDSDSSSSSSSSTSSSSSGVICSVINEVDQEDDQENNLAPGKKPPPVKTQDELLIEDLPAVDNLNISLPEDTHIEPIGAVSSIVDQLVIVESMKDSQPLNDDSVLFNKDRTAIGKVFEVFGPVFQPYYILRFNSHEDIEQKNLKVGETIFFAPKVKDFTDYIFTDRLNKFKGSDASWKNDQEPPPEALDFSDDEEEKLAKQKIKQQRRQRQGREESDSENETPTPRPQKPPRRKPKPNRNPQTDHSPHHNPRGRFHSNYHANPHFQPQGPPAFQHPGSPHFQARGNPRFQPDYMFPPPGPFQPPFPGPGFSPYPGPPPPPPPPPRMAMGMGPGPGPWPPGPYPGMMFHLPPPPPPPPPPSS